MDIATIGGIIAGLALVLWGITGNSDIGSFIDPPSITIVVGGTLAAYFVSHPLKRALAIGKTFGIAAKNSQFQIKEIITKVIELANIARREGLLALEEATSDIKDDFLQKGVMLIVDGTDPELVKSILETELVNLEDRHSAGKGLFDNLGALAPAFGMVGTLIGLVAMLQNLSDPASIGPSMAVALLTTFYGSLLANLVFIPISNKLSIKSKDEILIREIMVEGLLSIQAGENPRIIEEKLKSFLPPDVRKSLGGEEAGEADE